MEEEADTPPPRRRPTCPACARPLRTCHCASLPAAPHPLAGRLIILQHPHEAGRRKATAPLCAKCVTPVTILVGRTFHPEGGGGGDGARDIKKCPPALVTALEDAASGATPLFVLWPAAPDAVDAAGVGNAAPAAAPAGGVHAPPPPPPAYTLLALDGTWRQAREMWAAARAGWLAPGMPGITPVRVGAPPAGATVAGALFVEPDGGGGCGGAGGGGGGVCCMSTAEAVAAGLAALEPPGAPGPRAVARAVAAMADAAAAFDPAIAARLGRVERWGRGVEGREAGGGA